MKNSQKGFVVPLLIGIIALLVIGGGVYIYENKKVDVPVIVDTGIQQSNQVEQINSQDTVSSASPQGTNIGQYIQYKPFSTTKDIRTSAVYNLKKADKLPVTITLDGNVLTIKNINVLRSKLAPTRSFESYITVTYKDSDKKIGFWYTNPNPSTDLNGCGGNNCGGVLTIQTQQTETNPTAQEIRNGISGVVITKYIGISNIEYNFTTSDWKNIEISSQTLREPMPRNTTNGF